MRVEARRAHVRVDASCDLLDVVLDLQIGIGDECDLRLVALELERLLAQAGERAVDNV